MTNSVEAGHILVKTEEEAKKSRRKLNRVLLIFLMLQVNILCVLQVVMAVL